MRRRLLLVHPTPTAGFASKAVSATLLQKPVEGKNVIVTGSARGIGKSIALRLASDGYNVCINDVGANSKACDEVVKEIRSLGRKACSAVADVSKRAEVREMIQKSVKELGPLHTMYGCFWFFFPFFFPLPSLPPKVIVA